MLWCGDRLPYWLNIYNANFLLLYQLEFNVINFLQLLLTILSTIQENIDIFPFSQTLHILTSMLKCKSTCAWRSLFHDTIDLKKIFFNLSYYVSNKENFKIHFHALVYASIVPVNAVDISQLVRALLLPYCVNTSAGGLLVRGHSIYIVVSAPTLTWDFRYTCTYY